MSEWVPDPGVGGGGKNRKEERKETGAKKMYGKWRVEGERRLRWPSRRFGSPSEFLTPSRCHASGSARATSAGKML
ncbi:hypothetical protein NHX12_022685 [Muraenolepis orangiensis]|uniref:Uncharacterized protein n=1 Tax=Muraenolepis orangiensis TaxID=630683 RepID=A0A9Q0ERZ8_9TELE|nr:hypothetical protein NHX12_022685 [Muraenolepis orangiensis]